MGFRILLLLNHFHRMGMAFMIWKGMYGNGVLIIIAPIIISTVKE